MRTLVLFALTLAALAGCSSSEDTLPIRNGAAIADAGADADATPQVADPNGGRDDNASSCYATCSNAGFTCQTRGETSPVLTTVEMILDAKGCGGTLTTGSTTAIEQSVAITIECAKGEICWGAAPGAAATICASGTFSAFSFAYAKTTGAAQSICTRN